MAAGAAAMLMTLGVAHAASASSAAPAKPVLPAVNLTTAQQAALQTQVQKHLNDYGAGQQIGINQISWDAGRTILTLPLPGETKARGVNEAVAALGTANCSYLYACLWSDTNFNGTRLSRTDCATITLAAPFNTSTASVHNNQSSGTQTLVLNGSHQVLNGTLAPSRANDTGVGSRSNARYWTVC